MCEAASISRLKLPVYIMRWRLPREPYLHLLRLDASAFKKWNSKRAEMLRSAGRHDEKENEI